MTCPICNTRGMQLMSRVIRPTDRTSWEHESTVKLLGWGHASIRCEMYACPRCLHLWRAPLFSEAPLYASGASELRKEISLKYQPEAIGTRKSVNLKQAGEVFGYLSALFSRDWKLPEKGVAVLDWGSGSDGYIGDSVAKLLANVFNSKYPVCYQYDFQNGGEPNLIYDIVILSHVLEHVQDPIALLRRVKQNVGGVLLVAVPWEQHAWGYWWAKRTMFLGVHQHAFSPLSLRYALKAAGFKPNVPLWPKLLSYRGQMMRQIVGSAR